MPQSNSGLTRSWSNSQNVFRLAMDSIRAQGLRSFLLLPCVIIGVASVIMVGAAIEGLGVYAHMGTLEGREGTSPLVAGFSVSVVIGGFFGVWPTGKAAPLDPVEALRYE